MGGITNLDIFEEFFKTIQEGASLTKVLQEYGGSSIYIPSFKSTFRNELIVKDYQIGLTPRELAKKYSLSIAQIYQITKKERENE